MVNFTMLARNRPTLTRQALSSLVRAGMKDMKATVLDDESDEETAVFLKWHGAESDLFSIRNDVSQGTGFARNIVVKASEEFWGRGDYLYLSDNDVFFYPGWLGKLLAVYRRAQKHGFKVLGAYNHPYHQPIATVPITKGSWTLCNVHEVHALALQSMLMTWDVWDKYGPFCATPVGKVCQSEDVDFTNKIKADGGKIGVVSPPLLVNTGITNSFGEKIPGWEAVLKEAPAGVIVE